MTANELPARDETMLCAACSSVFDRSNDCPTCVLTRQQVRQSRTIESLEARIESLEQELESESS